MDITELEKEHTFYKAIVERDQNTNAILCQTLHELTQLLGKLQQEYDDLKRKYDALLKNTEQ